MKAGGDCLIVWGRDVVAEILELRGKPRKAVMLANLGRVAVHAQSQSEGQMLVAFNSSCM